MLNALLFPAVFCLVPALVFSSPAFLALENCDILDMTYTFDNATIYWPTADHGFDLTIMERGVTDGGFYYEANDLSAPEHGGTHLDAPAHFAKGKERADQVSLSSLIGEACVIDVSQQAKQNVDYEVTIGDLQAAEKANGILHDSCLVVVYTGWGQFWSNRTKYLGSPGKDASKLHFPSMGPEAARWLVQNRKIKALGVDTASLDFGQSVTFEVHQILLGADIPGLENLKNVDKLPMRGATLVAMPMKIGDGSGAPLRAFSIGWNGQNDPCRRGSAISGISELAAFATRVFLIIPLLLVLKSLCT